MEHRWGQRHQLQYTVSVRVGGWRAVAQVKDISASGAFLQCAVPRDQHMRICVDFSGAQRQPVLTAQVVRSTDCGVGIEWLEFAPEAVLRMLEGAETARPSATESGARVAA